MRKKLSWSLYLFLVAVAFGIGLTTTLVASYVLARPTSQQAPLDSLPTDAPARAAPKTVEC